MSDTDAVAAQLFELHYDGLQRYLVRFTGDGDAAADIAQETFVRLLEHAPAADRAVPWLFRVATNLARDHARRKTRRQILGQSDRVLRSYSDPPAAPGQSAERADARRTLDAICTVLNEKERTALLMREEGYTYAEIASVIDSPTGNIGTLMARALRKAAARMQQLEARP